MQRDDMCAESASVDQSRVVLPVLSKLFAMETCYDPKWCHPCLAACCLHFQIRTAGQCCTPPPGFPEVWREHGAGLGLIWKVLVCYVLSYDHVIQRNFYSSQLRSEAAGGEGEEGRRKEEEATLIKSTDPREEKNVRIDARKIQKECQHICQKVCQNRCQVECQKDCQSICQKDCQKSTYIHISSILILPDGTSETMSG